MSASSAPDRASPRLLDRAYLTEASRSGDAGEPGEDFGERSSDTSRVGEASAAMGSRDAFIRAANERQKKSHAFMVTVELESITPKSVSEGV